MAKDEEVEWRRMRRLNLYSIVEVRKPGNYLTSTSAEYEALVDSRPNIP